MVHVALMDREILLIRRAQSCGFATGYINKDLNTRSPPAIERYYCSPSVTKFCILFLTESLSLPDLAMATKQPKDTVVGSICAFLLQPTPVSLTRT